MRPTAGGGKRSPTSHFCRSPARPPGTTRVVSWPSRPAEKALKAYLFYQGEELIFTHSIFKLCDMAAQYAPDFTELKERVKLLDFYYVEARYPNALEDVIPAEFYNERDAEQAIGMAEAVIALVGRLCPTLPQV